MGFQVLPLTVCTKLCFFLCTQLNGLKYCYVILKIQFNINCSFAQLNGFKYCKWLSSFMGPIDGTLTNISSPGHFGPGSNHNENVLHISQRFPDWSLIIRWFSILSRTFIEEILPLCKNEIKMYCHVKQKYVV